MSHSIAPVRIRKLAAQLVKASTPEELALLADPLQEVASLAKRLEQAPIFRALAEVIEPEIALASTVTFAESNDPNNLYALFVSSEDPHLLKCLLRAFGAKEEVKQVDAGTRCVEASDDWNGKISLREVADAITELEHGGFFTVTYTVQELKELGNASALTQETASWGYPRRSP